MKKLIWTSSVKLNELFDESELAQISGAVENPQNKGVILKNMTDWATLYIDTDGIASVSDGYPLEFWSSLAFDKWLLSNIQICSDTANTDVRFLFV